MKARKHSGYKKVLPAALILFLVILVGLVFVALFFWLGSRRIEAFNLRPLVLIHSPVNRDEVRTGERIPIHATARLEKGIRRMELWVDEALIAEREIAEGPLPANLVLTETWVPAVPGNHVITVRAFSSKRVNGQASIAVAAVAAGEVGPGTYLTQEGDTLESIAAGLGVGAEELAGLNPDLGGGEPAAGEELIVPDTEPEAAGGDEPLPSGEGEAPAAEDEGPGSSGFLEMFLNLLLEWIPVGPADSQPATALRLEVLTLETGGGEESLHCYFSLGNEPAQWMPDTDGNQSTDESFAPLPGGSWDTASLLSGSLAPVILWPGDRALPFGVNCVGITGGGTDALDLGITELSIPPERWDGTARWATTAGPEGSYAVRYRISRAGDAPRGVPLYLDPDMTPPVNARIDDRRISLRWDYNPLPEEEAIDGFRVYLNGNLQWVEPADARESGLPYEWLAPPCGTSYTLGVTAYRFGFPDGPESMPAVTVVQPPSDDCHREIQISFTTLETFDLGGDGNYDDTSGDVGPVYGYFFANDERISFDARFERGAGGLDLANGLRHHSAYDVGEMAADIGWHFSSIPSTIVDLPEGGTFQFGFHIMDEDTGRCRDSDDRGCDDLVCEGFSDVYQENFGALDRHYEGTIIAENGRCQLSYVFGPAFGSPVGSGVEGWEPLPWIDVEEILIDENTGEVQIKIRNTGTATWPWKDLDVELRTRDGHLLGAYTWEDFALEAGQRATLENDDIELGVPFDACVLIDPYDNVIEQHERSGMLFHNPVCPPLPDLVVRDVVFDAEDFGELRVTVQNIGEGVMENRIVKLEAFLPDGAPADIYASWRNVTLGLNEMREFRIPDINGSLRERLQNGYSMVVDPNDAIPESNPENNDFTVAGPSDLKIWWCDSRIPHYHGYGSTARMFLNADILRGSESQSVFEESRSSTLVRRETYSEGYNNHCFLQGCNPAFQCQENSEVFSILGDEALRVSVQADFLAGTTGSRESLGTGTAIYRWEDGWGAWPVDDENDYPYPHCHDLGVAFPPLAMANPEPWVSYICIADLTEH